MHESGPRRQALSAWLASADDLLEDAQPPSPQVHEGLGVGRIWARVDKERDLQLHLRTGWLGDTEFITLADYIPSEKRYETELLIGRRVLSEVLRELRHLSRYLGR